MDIFINHLIPFRGPEKYPPSQDHPKVGFSMPLYDFKCEGCGVIVEKLVPMMTETLNCDACSEKMTRQVSSGSFILKGSGWYATDFKDKT